MCHKGETIQRDCPIDIKKNAEEKFMVHTSFTQLSSRMSKIMIKKVTLQK